MISVQNLLRQLNGNRFILCFFVLIIGLGFNACGSMKKAQGEKRTQTGDKLDPIEGKRKVKKYNPKTGRYEDVTTYT